MPMKKLVGLVAALSLAAMSVAGVVGGGELEEILLVEERELEHLALDQRPNGRCPHSGDPLQPLHRLTQ